MKQISSSVLLGHSELNSEDKGHLDGKTSREFSFKLNDNVFRSTICSVYGLDKIYTPHVVVRVVNSFLCPKVYQLRICPEWYGRKLLTLTNKIIKNTNPSLKSLKNLLINECKNQDFIRDKRCSSSFC